MSKRIKKIERREISTKEEGRIIQSQTTTTYIVKRIDEKGIVYWEEMGGRVSGLEGLHLQHFVLPR